MFYITYPSLLIISELSFNVFSLMPKTYFHVV